MNFGRWTCVVQVQWPFPKSACPSFSTHFPCWGVRSGHGRGKLHQCFRWISVLLFSLFLFQDPLCPTSCLECLFPQSTRCRTWAAPVLRGPRGQGGRSQPRLGLDGSFPGVQCVCRGRAETSPAWSGVRWPLQEVSPLFWGRSVVHGTCDRAAPASVWKLASLCNLLLPACSWSPVGASLPGSKPAIETCSSARVETQGYFHLAEV